jgi:hypothetical protein
VSYAITMTAAILGVAILVIAATSQVNQARAVYGCITLPGTRTTPSSYLCIDKPITSNIWKSEGELNATLNATGSYHVNGILWVFMNETVTANPTPECKAQNDYFSRNTTLSNDTTTILTLSNKCEDSIFNWNQIHPDNAVINPNEQPGQGLNG